MAVINGKHVELPGTYFRHENITGGSHPWIELTEGVIEGKKRMGII